MNFRQSASIAALGLTLALNSYAAKVIPAELPSTDKEPPAMDKPVKVYIVSGQSNMVGFGTLQNARPAYPSIFLSADPSILPGRMPVGDSALLPHKIYQSDTGEAAGATASVYAQGKDPIQKTEVNLGKVSASLPSVKENQRLVVTCFIEVPMSGMHDIHVGFEDSSYAVAQLDGKEVYRRDAGKDPVITKVMLEAGKRYPLSIEYKKSGSAALWLEHVDIKGKGDLTSLIKDEGKYPWFMDKDGNWTVRNDVIYREVRVSKDELGSGGPLTTTSNGKFIGPEVPFGFVMGAFHDEQVLIIESSMGNRALSFDSRPPSSGRTDPDNEWEGLEYRLMVEGVHKVLNNIDKVIPGYKGQGYELTGFAWFQGHKDRGKSKEEYEQHLVNLIQDLRKEFNAPDMRAVVATVGFDGENMIPEYVEILKAQMAVSDPQQHPEFAGKVASVDTRPFWRSQGNSPTGTGYHYNHNAETYVLTGDSLGRAMVELLGGKAEKLPAAGKKEARHPDVEFIYSDGVVSKYSKESSNPTPEQYAGMSEALKPIILDKLIPDFIAKAFGDGKLPGLSLADLVHGTKPTKMGDGIDSQIDTLISYYEAAGINDYSWKPVIQDMKHASWSYTSFDPPEKQAPNVSDRLRKITYPDGMESWFMPDFDAEAAGWKTGQAPFGQYDGELKARRAGCYMPQCGCNETPKTLWEKEVLLMRRTFELPPIKDGHAYRLLLGGAGCDRSGEGFVVYVNGKELTRVKGGFYRNSGLRGAFIYDDILPEFKGGKVTIAVENYLRYTHHRNQVEYRDEPVRPNGHVSLWMEEAVLPEPVLQAAGEKK